MKHMITSRNKANSLSVFSLKEVLSVLLVVGLWAEDIVPSLRALVLVRSYNPKGIPITERMALSF